MISGIGHVSDYPGGKRSLPCAAPAGGWPRIHSAQARIPGDGKSRMPRDNHALAAGCEDCLAPAHPV